MPSRQLHTLEHAQRYEWWLRPPHGRFGQYRSKVGITRDQFDSYFEGSSIACAILLKDVRRVVPAVELSDLRSRLKSFHPPQFFKRLHRGSPEFLLLRSHLA